MPKSDRGRFSAKRKREAVLRRLRGEDLDLVSREMGVRGATLATWRESFLEGGLGALRSKASDERDERIKVLERKLGQVVMENELLNHNVDCMEAGLPLARRRSRAAHEPLAGHGPVGDGGVRPDLQRAQDGQVDVSPANHRDAVGRVEQRGAGPHRHRLLAGIDQLRVLLPGVGLGPMPSSPFSDCSHTGTSGSSSSAMRVGRPTEPVAIHVVEQGIGHEWIERADRWWYCPAVRGWPLVLDCRVDMGHTYGLSWSWPLARDFFDGHWLRRSATWRRVAGPRGGLGLSVL